MSAITRVPGADDSLAGENQRIRDVFADRVEPASGPLDPYGLYVYHELLEALATFFREIGLSSLANVKMLDVGCGSGGMLWRLQVFGARPSNCWGIDLLRDKLAVAHQVSPRTGFVEGNAARLPFPDAAFDLAFQFVVLTSIVDPGIRAAIAREILRTLRPGGYVISYDFWFANPRNPHVRPLLRRELKELFAGCALSFRRITLAPPIGRPVARISPTLCRTLAVFPFLRSHDLCFARKPEASVAASRSR